MARHSLILNLWIFRASRLPEPPLHRRPEWIEAGGQMRRQTQALPGLVLEAYAAPGRDRTDMQTDHTAIRAQQWTATGAWQDRRAMQPDS